MSNTMKQETEPPDENVVQLFAAPQVRLVPPLEDEEILKLRQFINEFSIIRATCPIAVRALSKR